MSFTEFQLLINNIRNGGSFASEEYHCVINQLLALAFGEIIGKYIWTYIYDESDFYSLEELYEFVTDPYSKFLSYNICSLDELIDRNPEIDIFKSFKIYISNVQSTK